MLGLRSQRVREILNDMVSKGLIQKHGNIRHTYQDMQGIGTTKTLALPTLIAICSISLGKPILSSLAVLGEFSIGGSILKVEELANIL